MGSRPPNTSRPQREFVAVSSQFLYPTTTTPFQHRAFPSGPENPVPPPEVPDHPRTPQGRAPFPVLRQARPEHWRAGPGRQQPRHLPPRNSPNPPPNRLARGHVGSLHGFSDLDFLITSSTAPASATASCSPPPPLRRVSPPRILRRVPHRPRPHRRQALHEAHHPGPRPPHAPLGSTTPSAAWA